MRVWSRSGVAGLWICGMAIGIVVREFNRVDVLAPFADFVRERQVGPEVNPFLSHLFSHILECSRPGIKGLILMALPTD